MSKKGTSLDEIWAKHKYHIHVCPKCKNQIDAKYMGKMCPQCDEWQYNDLAYKKVMIIGE